MADTKESDETLKKSGAFYIDGSCRPHNPGYIGWGLHGYFYQDTCDKPVKVEHFVHTTDGYLQLTDELQKGVQLVTPIEYIDGYGSDREMLSNNVAEIRGLHALLSFLTGMSLKIIKIYTDSEYLKTCMNEWCKRWENNGWMKQDGNPVSNRELLKDTYLLLKNMKERKVDISINWIKSHNGHVGNERADILAGIGSSTSQQHSLVNSIEISQVKGYWKSEYERNPYVAFRRLYFNSISEYNQPGIYHLAESTETDFIIGKPSASTCYSVVYLKDHDPIIEMIKQKQFKISRGINVIVLMKLDSVYSRHVYPWLNHYGENTILRQGNTHSMTLVDKKPITVEIYPTGLSMRSLDYFAMLEEILVWFNEPRTNNIDLRVGAYKITTHSITDRFFKLSTDKKGKTKHELLPEFIVGYKKMMR